MNNLMTHNCIGNPCLICFPHYVYGWPAYPQPAQRFSCEHCWCQVENINQQPHSRCCMCGTRKLLIA